MTSDAATAPDIPAEVRAAVDVAVDRQALDLRALDLSQISHFTDFFVICSGSNERHVQAIADAIQRKLRDLDLRPMGIEGYDHGQWVVLDYGFIVVHIFSEEMREYYRLEGLWADAPDLAPALSM